MSPAVLSLFLFRLDGRTLSLMGGVVVVLLAANTILYVLRRRPDVADPALLDRFRVRLLSWWILCAVLVGTFLVGPTATVVLFGFLSFWALREFITVTPTRPGDRLALSFVFLVCPLGQYLLVGLGLYDYFSVAIPVYAFLLIPALIALSGDSKRFLERTAKIQTGLLICVYCLSYAPALYTSLDFKQDQAANANARLLFFFILMVQLSDALQYAWAQLPSRHVIVPAISPNKTWEGLLGGTASMMILGALLYWATPFSPPMAAGMAGVVALMGYAGALTMSAIKRDRGVQDYGTLVEGHRGVLDRIDSLCFAAPVFFHLARMYLG
jgi:phosphatidate cytidylyltransferase